MSGSGSMASLSASLTGGLCLHRYHQTSSTFQKTTSGEPNLDQANQSQRASFTSFVLCPKADTIKVNIRNEVADFEVTFQYELRVV
jgi:hypothetical protein